MISTPCGEAPGVLRWFCLQAMDFWSRLFPKIGTSLENTEMKIQWNDFTGDCEDFWDDSIGYGCWVWMCSKLRENFSFTFHGVVMTSHGILDGKLGVPTIFKEIPKSKIGIEHMMFHTSWCNNHG